jgi:CHAT domain-containing protein
MQLFYREFMESGDMVGALQHAMQEIRAQAPHPYYWAPFVLVGKLPGPTKPV